MRGQSDDKAKVKPVTDILHHLGPCRGHLKTILGHILQFSAILGLCCNNFGAILAQLAPSWGYLGIPFGPAWGYLVLLGAILCHLGTILNPKPKLNDSIIPSMILNLQRSSLKLQCFIVLNSCHRNLIWLLKAFERPFKGL